jgi:hypothetical protein
MLCRKYVSYIEQVTESKCCGIAGKKAKENSSPIQIFVYVYQSQVWISFSKHTYAVKVRY